MSVLQRGRVAAVFFGLLCCLSVSAPPGAAAPLPPARSVRLDALGPDEGARFGDWVLWNMQGPEKAICLVHPKMRQMIVLKWASNGWIHYQAPDGQWYIVYSNGAPQQQHPGGMAPAGYLDRKPPALVLAPESYKFANWTVKVEADALEFFTPAVKTTITVRRDSPVFVRNGLEIGGK
jgi:hypothetical protein